MMTRTTRRGWTIFGLWTIPTILSTVETVMFARMANRPMPVYRAFLGEAPQWYGWALLTPAIIALGERFPVRRPLRVSHVAVHAISSLAFSLLVAVADATVNMVVRPSSSGLVASTRSWFLGGLPATTIAYAAILAVSYAVAHAARLREQEVQLRDAQLSALRMQLQPHFLFNSLNAIMALVRAQETAAAVRALTLLGDVLRTTVNAGEASTTSLEQEVEFVRRYLDIERVRFGDRLRVTVDVPGELLPSPVPTFVLQPFVENALKHGVLRERAGNQIEIRAQQVNGSLTLTVRDDGQGLGQGSTNGGVGIANARARLERMYGAAASLTVRDANPGVEVEVRIPRA